jgi:hypothetical protein
MQAHLRVARPVSDLSRAARMYKLGLSLEQLAGFDDDEGFDGVMLGDRNGHFHLEFKYCRRHPVFPSPTPEDLLVFYVPEQEDWCHRCELLHQSGFFDVQPIVRGLRRVPRRHSMVIVARRVVVIGAALALTFRGRSR